MKVVVIDDSQDSLDYFKEILFNHFDVITFHSPLKAIEYMSVNTPDMVLCDCEMSEMHGLDFLATLKSDFPHIASIMYSGFRIEDNLEKALNLLCDDFFYKPISEFELIARIKNKIMKSAKATRLSMNSIANINFDDEAETVEIHGEKFPLKTTEYNLYKYFVTNSGKVLSKKEIKVSLWNKIDIADSVLDTHLCSLRKKLQKYGDEIVTKKSAGYIYESINH